MTLCTAWVRFRG